MSRQRQFLPDRKDAKAAAQALTVARKTCEGCAGLRLRPTPMCRQPSSPHFRMVREAYHERCGSYSIVVAGEAPGWRNV